MYFKLTLFLCFMLHRNNVISRTELSQYSGNIGHSERTFDRDEDSTSEPNIPDVSSHKNLGLLPKDCGNIVDNRSIVFGTETKLFEFPWIALISYRKYGKTELPGRNEVEPRTPVMKSQMTTKEVGVRVGEQNLNTNPDCQNDVNNHITCASPVQDIGIERLIVHPHYNKSIFGNDIGLIRLNSTLKFTDSVAPICLPVTQDALNYNITNRVVEVASFGLNQIGKNITTLEQNEISLIGEKECRQIYNNTLIGYGHLCAEFRRRENFCGVDSGGPLQVPMSLYGKLRAVQQGISSFGTRLCGTKGYPDVFTKVAYYMDWILDNISS